MEEKRYTSELNFQNPAFPAGCVFTEAQWVAKGGKADGLQAHLAKGYVTEWEGQEAPPTIDVTPSPLADTVTADSAETVILEDSTEEESGEEVAGSSATDTGDEESKEKDEEEKDSNSKPAPQGVWNFNPESLQALGLEALNALYKDHAAKYDISVRAYKDKDALIKKMCSEA